jgi:hypothetical protein
MNLCHKILLKHLKFGLAIFWAQIGVNRPANFYIYRGNRKKVNVGKEYFGISDPFDFVPVY